MKKLFNSDIKLISSLKKRKYRENLSLFIVEGVKPVRELYLSGIKPEKIVVDISKKLEISYLEGYDEIYSTEKFNKISTLENSEGILSVYKTPSFKDKVSKDSKKILLLHDISDPGNMGTLIRTAVWFGVESIILSGNCTDPFSPKSVRSCMGQIFCINFIKIDNCKEYIKSLDDFKIVSTYISEKSTYLKKDEEKTIVMIGSESNGLPEIYKDLKRENFLIEKIGKTESLNASIAAGIIMYEIFGK
ncbi:MAG: hypothetical protein CR982_03750 [Candidatus Cloacimonadota bacterium]|nr:MAG: hypothetical protein CR982_03750 [Candidatus Cloacimonadota bacterium]PIE79234.1 MAG: hypothetical protein CSA15_03935 [Candidatus Delongbacteria bacterium]